MMSYTYETWLEYRDMDAIEAAVLGVRYSDIQDSINNGATIGELIDKIRGPNVAPNAAIQPSEKNI